MGRPKKAVPLTATEEANLAQFEFPIAPETIIEDENDLHVQSPKIDLIPLPHEPEWHDYVMGHFSEDELYEGRPTVDGLRRVTEDLIGEIVESLVHIIEPPYLFHDNNNRFTPCTVVYTVKIQKRGTRDLFTYSDVYDVNHLNTKPEFARFPSSIAATRAEGRALRKALKLRKIITAEEAEAPTMEQVEKNCNINETQINFLDALCKRNDINLNKFVNGGSRKYNNIHEVPFETAAKMVQNLSEQQLEYTKINPNVKGYDEEWKKKAWNTF